MKRVHWFLTLLMAGLFCTGCWPMHITSSPGASGFVLDRQTRKAISGAQVAVSRAWKREWPNYGAPTLDEALEQTRPPQVVTGTNGQFAIPPERKWIMAYPAPEGLTSGTLIVRRDGYKPVIILLMEGLEEYNKTVLLTRVPGQP